MGSCVSKPFVGVLVTAAALLASHIIVACAQPIVEHGARYRIEFVNQAADTARVLIHVDGDIFREIGTGSQWSSYGSGIVALESNERRVFDVSAFGTMDSPEDSDLVRSFSRIDFFGETSDTPYRSYYYPLRGCRDVPPGSDCSDDSWVHRHPDGTEERLFVESPERPFYIERDTEDPELGRVVITFIPEANAGPVAAAVY